MKPLTLLILLFVSLNLFSQETDNPYSHRGKTLELPANMETEGQKKERNNREKVQSLLPTDLSDQFRPQIDGYLIGHVINAGNDDLIAQAIRNEYENNAQRSFHLLATYSILLILAIGLLITHNFKSKGGTTQLLFNAGWLIICFLCSAFYGNSIDDKLFMLSSNFLNLFKYSVIYSIVIASFYVFQKQELKMTSYQRKLLLLGFLTVLIFLFGFVTRGYANQYFESFENHKFNILGILLSLFFIGYLFFAEPKSKN